MNKIRISLSKYCFLTLKNDFEKLNEIKSMTYSGFINLIISQCIKFNTLFTDSKSLKAFILNHPAVEPSKYGFYEDDYRKIILDSIVKIYQDHLEQIHYQPCFHNEGYLISFRLTKKTLNYLEKHSDSITFEYNQIDYKLLLEEFSLLPEHKRMIIYKNIVITRIKKAIENQRRLKILIVNQEDKIYKYIYPYDLIINDNLTDYILYGYNKTNSDRVAIKEPFAVELKHIIDANILYSKSGKIGKIELSTLKKHFNIIEKRETISFDDIPRRRVY